MKILINKDAERLAQVLGCMPTYQREKVLNDVMYPAWAGFAAFWQRRRGERVTWGEFALRPHNTWWFLAWAFNSDDSLVAKVEAAIAEQKAAVLPPAG